MDFIRWHIPKRVLLFQPPETATVEEYDAHNQILMSMLDEGEAPIYLLLDLSQIKVLPGHLSELMERNPLMSHPHLKHIIAYGVDKGMFLLTMTIADFVSAKVDVITTYEEALEILAHLGVS